MPMSLRTKVLSLRLRLAQPRLAPSWEAACQAAGEARYEDEALTRFRVERMALNRRLGHRLPVQPAAAFARDWLAARLDGVADPLVVDFGGADGAFLRQLAASGLPCRGLVIESPALVAALPAELKDAPAYSDRLPPAMDVFYSACALNYVDDPYPVLEHAFASSHVAVVLQRNSLSNDEQFRVQLSSLHGNGWGAVPPGWPDRLVAYPQRTLQPSRILPMARRHGFALLEVQGNPSGMIGRAAGGQFGVDLYFGRP